MVSGIRVVSVSWVALEHPRGALIDLVRCPCSGGSPGKFQAYGGKQNEKRTTAQPKAPYRINSKK